MTAAKPDCAPTVESKQHPPPICLEQCDCAAQAELQVSVYRVDFARYGEKPVVPDVLCHAVIWLMRQAARLCGIQPSIVLRSRLARDGETLASFDDETHPIGCGVSLQVWTARPCKIVNIPHALIDLAARRMIYEARPGRN